MRVAISKKSGFGRGSLGIGIVAVVAAATGCSGAAASTEKVGTTNEGITFEQFEKTVYRDHDGLYIVDGDTSMGKGDKRLREFFESIYSPNKLIVNEVGQNDDSWSSAKRHDLTYCVNTSFGAHHDAVVQAMKDATGAWAAAADVQWRYIPAQDAKCTPDNANVLFDIRPSSGESFIARSFFPSSDRSERNIIVDDQAFEPASATSPTLAGVLRHELGHTIGFRHEHTRPEAGTCFEDDNWRILTPYDQGSVMHYPQCNGISSWALVLTANDKAGAKKIYGAPGSNGPTVNPGTGNSTNGGGDTGGSGTGGDPGDPGDPTDPTDPTDPGDGTTENFSDTVGQGGVKYYGPFAAGSHVTAALTGSGDADLYVRYGAKPTTSSYNCRPYRDDSNETCDIDAAGASGKAYVMIRGYAKSTFKLAVTYR